MLTSNRYYIKLKYLLWGEDFVNVASYFLQGMNELFVCGKK